MKKFFLMMVLMVMGAMCADAQNELKIESVDVSQDYNATMVMSCPQKKDVLFRAAKEWMATNVKDFQQNLQYEDKETGTLKVKMTSGVSAKKPRGNGITVWMRGNVEYVTTLTIKDGRYRLRTENATAHWTETLMMGTRTETLGKKTLDWAGFLKWCQDENAVNTWIKDINNLACGIGEMAEKLEKDDDF